MAATAAQPAGDLCVPVSPFPSLVLVLVLALVLLKLTSSPGKPQRDVYAYLK